MIAYLVVSALIALFFGTEGVTAATRHHYDHNAAASSHHVVGSSEGDVLVPWHQNVLYQPSTHGDAYDSEEELRFWSTLRQAFMFVTEAQWQIDRSALTSTPLAGGSSFHPLGHHHNMPASATSHYLQNLFAFVAFLLSVLRYFGIRQPLSALVDGLARRYYDKRHCRGIRLHNHPSHWKERKERGHVIKKVKRDERTTKSSSGKAKVHHSKKGSGKARQQGPLQE